MAISDELWTRLVDWGVLLPEQVASFDPRLGLLRRLEQLQESPAWYDAKAPALTPYQRNCIELRLKRDNGLRDLEQDLRLNRYLLLDQIGEGGMGVVYRAWSPDRQRVIAIKQIRSQGIVGRQHQLLDRLQREDEILTRLVHPNVVKCYGLELSSADSRPFLLMEFVSGCTLENFLGEHHPVPLTAATAWLTALLSAVMYTHREGIIHRDLSWKNVMILRDGPRSEPMVKLLDFGLGKIVDSSVDLTQSQQVMGTFQFMSPEHFDGAREIDERSDMYSLGCLAYALFTGRPPFLGPTQPAYIRQHLFDTPKPMLTLRSDCPNDLSWMVGQMLSKSPADRQTAEHWLNWLSQRLRRSTTPASSTQEAFATPSENNPPPPTGGSSTWPDAQGNDALGDGEHFVSVASKPTLAASPTAVAVMASPVVAAASRQSEPPETNEARYAFLSSSRPRILIHPHRSWLGWLCLGYASPLAQRSRFIDSSPTVVDVLIFWGTKYRWLKLVIAIITAIWLSLFLLR